MSSRPASAARCAGLRPSASGARTSTPLPASRSTRSAKPWSIAHCQLPGQHLGRRLGGLAQSALPRTAVAAPEAELEQQLQVTVVGSKHPVVQRLSVVRVGTAGQQQAGQRQRMRVPRLPTRALLALAEHAGQHGERGGQPEPQVAGVRVGAGVQQQPRAAQEPFGGFVRAECPGVGQVHQRRPPVRSGLRVRRSPVGGQVQPDRVRVGRGGRGGDRVGDEIRVLGRAGRGRPPSGPGRPARCRPGRPAGRRRRPGRCPVRPGRRWGPVAASRRYRDSA